LVEVLIIAATVAIAAWTSGAQAHRRIAASRALERYAASRRLRFVPAPAGSPGAGPRVLGDHGGVAFAVDLYRLGADLRTRVCVSVPDGRAAAVSIAQRGAFAWREPPRLSCGHAALDAAYVILDGAAEDLDALGAIAAPLLVIAARPAVWLRSDGRTVTLSWRGTESDPAILDLARNVAVTVSGWRRAPSPYR
jgi:hypothetical protein